MPLEGKLDQLHNVLLIGSCLCTLDSEGGMNASLAREPPKNKTNRIHKSDEVGAIEC